MSLEAWIRALARRKMLFESHGLTFGHREARCWGRSSGTDVSLLDRLMSRRVFTFETHGQKGSSDEVEALRSFDPSYVYGYPSVVAEFVRQLQRTAQTPPPLAGVVLTAEQIPPGLSRDIENTLQCPVIREYGCSETDIIAFDCPAGRYHVASDHVIVEAIDVEDGVGEAVVTDLDNFLTPLIRYRLGDRIRLSTDSCPCGRTSPVIASIEGRTGHARYLVLPDGSRRHSVLFAYLFEQLRESGWPIRQFEVQQTAPDRLRVLLDFGDEQAPNGFREELMTRIERSVGAPMEIDVVIGPLRRTAGTKWNYFVPLT
jgi:phenylacetate-CoA ligase